MSMLSKVKKLGNKLFSGVKVDKGASDDGSGSHNSGSHEQPGQSKNHSKLGPPLAPSSATDMASPSVAPSGKSFSSNPAPFLSAAKRAALMSMQVHTSTESLGIKSPARNDIVLPAVQIVPHALPSSHLHVSVPSSHLQLAMPSSRLQESVPSSQLQMSTPSNVVQAQLQDTSHSSGPMCTLRRKSTPAELDMALHSAEGRSAIQQLLTNQQGNKPMAFAQYFGTSISSTATPSMPSPAEVPRPPLAQRVGKQTVPEEDVVDGGDDISSSAAALAGSAAALAGAAPVAGPKPSTPKGSAAHRPAPSASATAAAAAAAARAPSPKPALQPEDSEPALASVPVPSPRGVPAKVNYVPPEDGRVTPPAPRTKLLSLSPHLPAIMMRKNWSLSDYSIVRKMYTGYASTVYQATCRKSLEQVALKVYHMENLCELNHYQVYREIRVHSTLQHQNIIHLLASFQEGMDVVLVQEYAEGGDLYRLLHRNGGRLSERQAVEMVLHPFLLALHYLHTRGIMHRDVKPENVLFTEHRVLKLADFGLAIDLNEERAVTRAGTLDYMAPEVLRCPPKNLPQENKNNAYLHYTNSVDAWAVGVFAYELVVGFPPFAGESQLDSVEKIMHSTPEFPEKMTELAKSFICQALKKHPGDRPTVIEMLHHPWIRSYQRRTSMLHMPVPRTRRGSSVAYAEHGKLSPLPGTPPAEPSSPAPKAQPQPLPAAAAAAPTSGHLRMAAAVAGGPSSGSLKPLPAAMPSSGSLRTALSTTSEASSQAPLFDGNPEDMTPEQIEEMIRKLMLAKQAAIDRTSNSKGSAWSSGHAPVVPGS